MFFVGDEFKHHFKYCVSFNSLLNSLNLLNIHKCIKHESDGFSKRLFYTVFLCFLIV